MTSHSSPASDARAAGRARLGRVLGWTLGPVALLAAFFPVLRAQFIRIDDPFYVTSNPMIQKGFSGETLAWLLTGIEGANYHPLTMFSLLLDRQLFGTGPFGFHLVNLLLHLLNSALLYRLFRAWGAAPWRSGLATALFALHPLRVESVAWVSERKDVLCACFGLLALLAYTRYVRRPSVKSYLPVAGFLFLGLLAKSMLVTLPFLLILLDFWPLHRWSPRSSEASPQAATHRAAPVSRKLLLVEKIPLILIAFFWSALTYIAQHHSGAVKSLEEVAFADRLANIPVAYVRYLGKTLWPSNLLYFYPLPPHGWAGWTIAGSAALLLAVTAGAWWLRRARPHLLVGWLWFLGMSVPVIGLVQVGTQSMADRYTYLPGIGLVVMAAWSLPGRLERSARLRPAFIAASLALLATLGTLTHLRSRVWFNTHTLVADAVAKAPNHVVAHFMLGDVLLGEGDASRASEHFRRVLALVPDADRRASEFNGEAHFKLGLIAHDEERFADALQHYQAAVTLNPGMADAWFNAALALESLGQTQEAMVHYRRALEIDPSNSEAHNNLGLLLVATGQTSEAVLHLRHAVEANPQNESARRNLRDLESRLRSGR